MRRVGRGILAAVALGLALLLALDASYFLRGSLAWYPTPEQQETVRVVTGVIGAVLASALLAVLALRRSL
jgi:hypothetical protein